MFFSIANESIALQGHAVKIPRPAGFPMQTRSGGSKASCVPIFREEARGDCGLVLLET